MDLDRLALTSERRENRFWFVPSVLGNRRLWSLSCECISLHISLSPLGKMATTTEVLVTSDLSNTFAAEFYSSSSTWHMNPSFVCVLFKALSQSKNLC